LVSCLQENLVKFKSANDDVNCRNTTTMREIVSGSLQLACNTTDVSDDTDSVRHVNVKGSNIPRRTPDDVNKSLRHSCNTPNVSDDVNKSLRHSFNTPNVSDVSGRTTPSTMTSHSRKRSRLGSGVSVGRKSFKLSTTFDN